MRISDWSSDVCSSDLVRAELIGHDNARDDTHAKDNGKYLQPIAKEIGINASSGFQPQGFQHHQIACKPNGKSRKNEVDADGKGELKAGQQKRCLGIWHEDWLPWRFPTGEIGRASCRERVCQYV